MTRLESNIVLLFSVLCICVGLLYECTVAVNVPKTLFLALTCGMAFPLVALAGYKHFKNIHLSTLWKGGLLALLLAGKILSEWDDCTYLDPAVASSYDALQVIFVPLFLLVLKRRPHRDQIIGAAIIIVGILLMRGSFTMEIADYADYTLYLINPASSTVFASALVVGVMLAVQKEDPIAITIIEIGFAALIGLICCCVDGSINAFSSLSNHTLGQIFAVSFFGLGLAYFMVNTAQRYTDAMTVALITSITPFMLVVLAGILPSVYFETVQLTPFALIGSCVVVAGAFLSGTGIISKTMKSEAIKGFQRDTLSPVEYAKLTLSEVKESIAAEQEASLRSQNASQHASFNKESNSLEGTLSSQKGGSRE